MEVVISLVLVVGLVVLAFGRARTDQRKPRRRSSTGQYTPVSRRTAKTEPGRFDAQARKPAPTKATLHGAAYVVDGDTLVIRKTQIRLFGVDAPEMNHPFGNSAKWALVAMCKGQTLRAEIVAEDHYGRTVARCYLQDGRDVSAEMVKLGLALDWAKFSGGQYRVMEPPGTRKKLLLADARQKGRMHVWEQFEARQSGRTAND